MTFGGRTKLAYISTLNQLSVEKLYSVNCYSSSTFTKTRTLLLVRYNKF